MHPAAGETPASLSNAPQTFIDAPNPASGPIPDDVAPFFGGPYFEWCAGAAWRLLVCIALVVPMVLLPSSAGPTSSGALALPCADVCSDCWCAFCLTLDGVPSLFRDSGTGPLEGTSLQVGWLCSPSCRWNANRDAEGRWSYEGWQRSVKAIEQALAEHGGTRGFDGLMGFSQVTAEWLGLGDFVD